MFTDATCYESYAGNANREMCASNGTQTSFAQKSKRAKEKREKDFARWELARVRATAMEDIRYEEGAFLLAPDQAGKTETLYFSIDIHTSNVVRLMDRPMEQQLAEAT